MDWNGKPYHSLDWELKKRFGTKVYKVALDGGMTCPNRDGTLGRRGCIFCSEGGSGDFAAKQNLSALSANGTASPDLSLAVQMQIEEAGLRIRHKMGKSPESYLAYFQSYTNTYAPVPYLRTLFSSAIAHPSVRALAIGTRPDCLSDEVLDLCEELNQIKPVWIELGLQTIHEESARFIRRGYPLSCFEDALERLRAHNLETIVHVILGLPGESREDMLKTVSWLGSRDIQGIKLQLLHILRGTDLCTYYENHPFSVFSMEEYLDLVIDCVSILPPEIVIHRLTGDGPKSLLVAPLWSANKRLVLNTLTRRFKERNIYQGCARPH
ncbi:TIGR01212 family radical SAM protein [Brotaphodocola sp.]|uniref:TIGR01212 family radical SAM protein n=1 Tax=Brotaphodocola sp. TaxID=3073577 RepID=UPI003D7D8902